MTDRRKHWENFGALKKIVDEIRTEMAAERVAANGHELAKYTEKISALEKELASEKAEVEKWRTKHRKLEKALAKFIEETDERR